MRCAGAAVARLAERMTRSGELILFLAGKGHNGDDAAYACDFVRERERLLSRVIDPEISAAEFEGHLARRPSLLVDGLFGVGLNRPLSGVWMSLIERINRAGLPILSVDLPSGLSADCSRAGRCLRNGFILRLRYSPTVDSSILKYNFPL